MIQKVIHNNTLLAIIVPKDFSEPGVTFFTSEEYSQQLAFMSHSAGKAISPHIHNEVSRNVRYTQEVLFIRKGKLRVDFYDNDRIYIESRILTDGDVILLTSGGHGFHVLEDVEMIEVKQGPYAGDNDKTVFSDHSVKNNIK